MTKVYVARIEARNWDTETRAFATAELAGAWRDKIVAENWRAALGGKPADPVAAAEAYFDAGDGSFSIEECEVKS